jgi:transcriptional regulator with XRE-family HTH domain
MLNDDLKSKATQAAFQRLSIGDRLRWLIEVRGIKQTELAEKIGVTQAAISNIVTDSTRKPSAPTLMKLAAALQCNPTWILTGEGDPYGWAPVTSTAHVELLNLYRAMSPDSQAALLTVARSMAVKKG